MALVVFAALFHHQRFPHAAGGPEAGFASFGLAQVCGIVIAIAALAELVIASFPFRTVPALLFAAFVPAALGAFALATAR